MVETEYCKVCMRNVKLQYMTLHHHMPKSKGGTLDDTMRICKCCHENLHYFIDIHAVPKYNTVEKLELHPGYQQYIEYIRSVTHNAMYSVKDIKHKLKKKQLAA